MIIEPHALYHSPPTIATVRRLKFSTTEFAIPWAARQAAQEAEAMNRLVPDGPGERGGASWVGWDGGLWRVSLLGSSS